MNVNVQNEEIKNQMGDPFWCLSWRWGIDITTDDLDYLNNVVKADKCYDLITNSYCVTHSTEFIDIYTRGRGDILTECHAKINQFVFYDKFYKDPKCPRGIKLSLFVVLGQLKNEINFLRKHIENPAADEMTTVDYRKYVAESWQDRIASTGGGGRDDYFAVQSAVLPLEVSIALSIPFVQNSIPFAAYFAPSADLTWVSVYFRPSVSISAPSLKKRAFTTAAVFPFPH